MPEINGLYPTRTRLALLKAIHAGGGDVYCEAKVVYAKSLGQRVTERVREQIQHGWIRALEPGEARGRGEASAPGVTFYRLTDIGERVLADDRGRHV
jgi:hypothetical protein